MNIKVLLILHLMLLSGCSSQPILITTITSYSQTAIPDVAPVITKSPSVSTREQNKVTGTPINQKETPIIPTPGETIVAPSLDVIYLFSRDLGSTYFFLNPLEKERNTWLEPEKIRSPPNKFWSNEND